MVKLPDTLTAYRIGDPDGRYPIFDDEGARLYPGRWNKPSSPMIYASEHYSTAMLEKIVHLGPDLPSNQHFVKMTIPAGIDYEVFNEAKHPGWDGDPTITKDFGDTWYHKQKTLILIVPCIAARMEKNILINRSHPDFHKITTEIPLPVWWDDRLHSNGRSMP